jgi:hypothetical protein
MFKVNQLVGFGARRVSFVPLTTLSLQASQVSNFSQTITGPASIQAGDILILHDFAYVSSGGPPAAAIPSGFTTIVNLGGSIARSVVSYKIADGSEASASLSGMPDDEYVAKMLYVFRGNAPATSVNVAGLNQQLTGGDPTSQNVAASGGAVPLLVIGAYGSGGGISPRTFNPAKDGEINGISGLAYLAYKIYNSSPADTAVDMVDEGGENTLVSFYMEVGNA